MMYDATHIDLSFPLRGQILPLDSGYAIYSALSNLCPYIHELQDLAIHPIAERPDSSRQLHLTKRSCLQIRIPAEQIPFVYEFLIDRTFRIEKEEFHLGIPEYKALSSCSRLYSRLVIIRRCIKPEVFLDAARRQLTKLGVRGKIDILKKKDGQLQCRQLMMNKKEGKFLLRGYGVGVTDLSDEDSFKLQKQGIGGKHKMMCGVFVPSHNSSPIKMK